MAITELSAPQDIHPAYNECYYVFSSTNSGESGFRYVITVKKGIETLGTYKLRPTPVNQLGEVDVRSLLQTQLGFSWDFPVFSFTIAQDQRVEYALQVDEEYLVTEDFSDYVFMSGAEWSNFSDPVYNPTGAVRTGLEFSTEPIFEQGDLINVEQNATPNFRNELEGIHTVLDKFQDGGTWYIVLDLNWIGSGSASGGKVLFADNKKSYFVGITTDLKTAFRAAFSQKSFIDYDETEYTLTGSTSKALTNLTEGVRVSRTTPSYLKIYKSNGVQTYVEMYVGPRLYRYSIGIANDFFLINVLPSDSILQEEWNGSSWIAYSGNLQLETTDEVIIVVRNSSGERISEEIKINLYSECDLYDTYDITFLDRKGSWITIPFNKGSYADLRAERQEYRRKYGSYEEGSWNYTQQDRGRESFYNTEETTYKVNSGIISEEEAFFYRELITSPSVFLTENGEDPVAINVTNSNYNIAKRRTKRDRKLELSFVKSIQDSING